MLYRKFFGFLDMFMYIIGKFAMHSKSKVQSVDIDFVR